MSCGAISGFGVIIMERTELLTRMIERACSIIKNNATLSASEYRELNSLSGRRAVRSGAKALIRKIASNI